MQEKKNRLFPTLPVKFRTNDRLKRLFYDIIDDKVYDFIAKKVSNLSGDIRVAFDLLKTAMTTYRIQLESSRQEDPRLTVGHLLKIYE
jgi:hypothetical protein